MTLDIAVEDPRSADCRALISGSERALREVYTAAECFSFSADELTRPGVRFYVARLDGRAVGCVALCDCGDYAEVKRLYVAPQGRGSGIGRALMARLEADAVAANRHLVRLETGDRLTAAVGLYSALGYASRGPFGTYADHPASLFMEKRLQPV